MRKEIHFIFMLVLSVSILGCVSLKETSKVIWGSSTKALEEKRVDAVKKTFQCRYQECFDEVLRIAQEKKLTIFINNPQRDLIVLMKVPGSIDTTEVGIFFSDLERETRVEIVSLSPKAQQGAIEIMFPALAKKYPEVNQPK